MTLRENAIQSVQVRRMRATSVYDNEAFRVVANGKALTGPIHDRKEAHRQARHWRAILQGMIPSGQQSGR